MKNILITAWLLAVSVSSYAQNKSTMEKETIQELVKDFAAAVDKQDTAASAKYLDENFRVILNNFPQAGNTTLLSKDQYLGMMKAGKVGGSKRIISFLLADVQGNNAVVKVKLEGDKNIFTTYYNLIRKNEHWLIVGDMPEVITK